MTYEDKSEGALLKVGGRRFILALLVTLLSFALAWLGKIDGNILRDLVLGTFGFFAAVNVAQKIKTTKSTTTTTTEEEPA